MIEFLEWVFQSFWYFAGVFALLWLVLHFCIYLPYHAYFTKLQVEHVRLQVESNKTKGASQ